MKHFFSKFSNAAPIAGNSLRDLSPWPILYKLDLYGNETFSEVVSGIKTWPHLNVDLPTIASCVRAPGQFCTNWTYCNKTSRAQSLAEIECRLIDDSLGGSSPRPTLYMLDLLYHDVQSRLQLSAVFVWPGRHDGWKKWRRPRTANWTCLPKAVAQLHNSIEQYIYLEFSRAERQWCWLAAIQKRSRIRLPSLEANPDSNFDHGVSRHVEILRMSENLWLLWMRIYSKFLSKDRQIIL